MNKLLGSIGVFAAILLVIPAQTFASSGLNNNQITAITALLRAFDADESVIANVELNLLGSNETTSAALGLPALGTASPAFYVDLTSNGSQGPIAITSGRAVQKAHIIKVPIEWTGIGFLPQNCSFEQVDNGTEKPLPLVFHNNNSGNSFISEPKGFVGFSELANGKNIIVINCTADNGQILTDSLEVDIKTIIYND